MNPNNNQHFNEDSEWVNISVSSNEIYNANDMADTKNSEEIMDAKCEASATCNIGESHEMDFTPTNYSNPCTDRSESVTVGKEFGCSKEEEEEEEEEQKKEQKKESRPCFSIQDNEIPVTTESSPLLIFPLPTIQEEKEKTHKAEVEAEEKTKNEIHQNKQQETKTEAEKKTKNEIHQHEQQDTKTESETKAKIQDDAKQLSQQHLSGYFIHQRDCHCQSCRDLRTNMRELSDTLERIHGTRYRVCPRMNQVFRTLSCRTCCSLRPSCVIYPLRSLHSFWQHEKCKWNQYFQKRYRPERCLEDNHDPIQNREQNNQQQGVEQNDTAKPQQQQQHNPMQTWNELFEFNHMSWCSYTLFMLTSWCL